MAPEGFSGRFGRSSGEVMEGVRTLAGDFLLYSYLLFKDPRGNFHSRTGEPVHSSNDFFNHWNFKIDVRLVILLLGGWSEHFIGKVNPDDF